MSQALSNTKQPIHLMVGTDESGEIFVYAMKDAHQAREFRDGVRESGLDMRFIYAPIYNGTLTASQALADLRESQGITEE